MKVHIVYLSPTDDIDSTRDMLGWVQAPRALLVWPSSGEVLERHYDLVLLKRFADRRNIAVGLLTFNPEIRKSAAEMGVPVFESLEELPEERWAEYVRAEFEPQDRYRETGISRPPEVQPGWAPRLEARSNRWILGLATLTIGISLLIGPSAQIELSPPRSPQEIEINIELDAIPGTYEGIQFAKYDVTVSAKASAAATGLASLPISAAHGEVVLTNRSTEAVRIPANTGLRTSDLSPVRFQTSNEVFLPSGANAEVTVAVHAITQGQTGNIPSGQELAVEGPLGLLVSATNPRPFVGGSVQTFPSVSDSDYGGLRTDLEEKLLQTAESRMRINLSRSELLIEGSGIILRAQEVASHEVGEITDSFNIDLEQQVRLIVVNRWELGDYLESEFRQVLPGGHALVPGSTRYHIHPFSTNLGVPGSMYGVVGHAESYLRVDHGKIVQAVRGRTLESALRRLADDLPAETNPRIAKFPGWFPLLPLFGIRIDTQYEWDA